MKFFKKLIRFYETYGVRRAACVLQLFAGEASDAKINKSTDNGEGNNLTPEMKTFYDKNLIRMAKAQLVHDQFGQKRPIPKHGGKSIEFRKFAPLAKAITPLTEGVTPNGNSMDVSTVVATVSQYGDYIIQTDILELTAIDNTIVEATDLLGTQAGLTLDTITRNVLQGNTVVRHASKWNGTTETLVAEREDMDGTCVLNVQMVRRVANLLKRVNAPKINGDYIAIVHPDVTHELMKDAEWVEAHKYARPENIYTGEIGKIAGVRFVETSEAKIEAPDMIVDKFNRLTVKENTTNATTVVVREAVPSKTFSGGLKVYVDGVEKTLSSITYNGNGSTLTFSAALTVTAGKMICGKGAAPNGMAVYSTLIFGEGAYGVTEVEGGGLQTIVKQLGSSGVADALNQRGSVGWKALKTAEILIPDYLYRVESVSPDFSYIAETN